MIELNQRGIKSKLAIIYGKGKLVWGISKCANLIRTIEENLAKDVTRSV